MAHEGGFDLNRRNLVTGAYDQIVGAPFIPEITVVVRVVGIAGDIPSVFNILALEVRRIEVTTTRGPEHCQPSRDVSGNGTPGFIYHHGFISRHWFSRCSRPDFVLGGGDEDMQHLGRADAVDDLEPCRYAPRLKHRKRQALSRRDTLLERGHVEAGD